MIVVVSVTVAHRSDATLEPAAALVNGCPNLLE
jgi:hypothetical protein